MILEEILKIIPKIDLHCHLSGSVRPETILEIALEEGISIDLIKGKYKSFDWTNINKKNLVVYLMNLSEKETLSKKHLINFMPKVYITYLLIKFVEARR